MALASIFGIFHQPQVLLTRGIGIFGDVFAVIGRPHRLSDEQSHRLDVVAGVVGEPACTARDLRNRLLGDRRDDAC